MVRLLKNTLTHPLFIFSILMAMLFGMPMTANGQSLDKGQTILNGETLLVDTGDTVSFDDIKGPNGMIVIFSRSLDWCPYCQNQARDWNGYVDEVKNLGYTIAVVTYDSPKEQNTFVQKNDIQYAVISDTDSQLIKKYGLLNAELDKDHRFYGVPNPTIFVVDENGVITDKFAEDGYKSRPDISHVLSAIQ